MSVYSTLYSLLAGMDVRPFAEMLEGIYGTAGDEAIDEVLQDPTELLAILGEEEGDPEASTLVRFLRATGKKAQQATEGPQASTSGATTSQESAPPAKKIKVEPGASTSTSTPATTEEIETAVPMEERPLSDPKVRELVSAIPIIPVDHDTLHVFGIPQNKMPQRDPTLYSGQYGCVVCGRMYSNRPEACTHTRAAHLGTCLQCPYCQYRNHGGRQWLNHMKREHKDDDFFPANPPMMEPEQAQLISQIAEQAQEILAKKSTPVKGTGKGRGKRSGR